MFRPVIVIPCFNHANAFAGVAERLAEQKIPVIVVDDGSDKAQATKLKQTCTKYGYTYQRCDKNAGKGAAMRTGFRRAAADGFSHALQIDADGQHDINDIPKFLELAKKHPDALIVGQPEYDSSAPKARLIGRKITNFWVAVETLNCHMPDAMCGFRVYPVQITNKIMNSVHFLRMGFDIEVLVKLYRAGVRLVTQKTRVIYPKSGVSHFHVWRDNFYISLMHTYLCCGLPWWLIKKIGKLFLFIALLSGAANAQNITEMPATLKAFTDNLDTAYASYNQAKTMPESVKTFRAGGTVKFIRGVGFKWKQLSPNSFDFTSTLDAYCINGDKNALSALPYFSQIQSLIQDMLNGDMDRFLTVFSADYTETHGGKNWTLIATPKISAVAGFLKSMKMSGNTTDLNQIVITYTNGTKIVIDFERINGDSPDEIKC